MDPSFPNIDINLDDSQNYPNFQNYESSDFFSNLNQFEGTKNIQNSQNTGKLPRGDKWDTDEDVALMSAWVMASEDSIRGKNQKSPSLWGRVKQIYDASQMENPNPKRFGNRNIAQMKGRWKRLNESVQKWVAAYREAYRHKRSGMSMNDVENEAHKIYEAGGSKFNDSVVFNTVMCNHPKWDLQLHRDTTRTEREVGDEESGSSTKRSRTSEEGDYCFPSNPETPTTGGSSSQRPTGRDMAKKKGKGKVSNEIVEEIRALRLTRGDELEVMRKRLDLDKEKEQKKEEREKKREEREVKKMQLVLLNTLLAKENLSPEDEETKRFLLSKLYGM